MSDFICTIIIAVMGYGEVCDRPFIIAPQKAIALRFKDSFGGLKI